MSWQLPAGAPLGRGARGLGAGAAWVVSGILMVAGRTLGASSPLPGRPHHLLAGLNQEGRQLQPAGWGVPDRRTA